MFMCRFSFIFSLVATTSALVLASEASAQTPPRTPSAEPARIENNLRNLPSRQDMPDGLITVPDDKTGAAKPIKGGASFTLTGIDVKQASAFSADELKDVYAADIGKPATLETLSAIAARITAKYRNAGFILTRAIVPPQKIKGGVATITVVEGFVDQVVFEGSEKPSTLLREYAERIRASRPLNTEALERYLLLMQDLPGLSAKAVLRPSASVPGASDVVITLAQKHVDGSVQIDNRGTRYLGPVQGGLTLNANNLLGWHDRTQLRGVTTVPQTSELRFFQLSHDEQVDSEGTRLTVSAARTRTRPSYRLKNFDIEGHDSIYSAALMHPLVRSRKENLYATAMFDHRQTESKTLGRQLYGDRLNVARIGTAYDVVDRFTAVNRLETQISKGFGWNDNIDPRVRSRAVGRTDFWKATAQANRLQPLSSDFSLFVGAQGQVASAALLSAEQFGVGGANFGSAYDPSEITGDSGVATRTELQYNPLLRSEILTAFQFYGFYDVGTVYNRNPAAGQKRRVSLASTGLGLRFNILEPLSGSLEVAQPLTRDVSTAAPRNGDDPRVFFSLAYRF